ncbi:hypothetical protein [Thalassotalea insulae]|uniref:hypothetical protein n=1 Tax=Thalassotalea insulae TaxID=2056778 RepID=UPI0024E11241|nr:hypothetical protein [Thalassotalea insulae]
MGQVYLSSVMDEQLATHFAFSELAPQYNICNTLLIGFLLSEICKYGAQLVYYRKEHYDGRSI